jgi:hypothetical protein
MASSSSAMAEDEEMGMLEGVESHADSVAVVTFSESSKTGRVMGAAFLAPRVRVDKDDKAQWELSLIQALESLHLNSLESALVTMQPSRLVVCSAAMTKGECSAG